MYVLRFAVTFQGTFFLLVEGFNGEWGLLAVWQYFCVDVAETGTTASDVERHEIGLFALDLEGNLNFDYILQCHYAKSME